MAHVNSGAGDPVPVITSYSIHYTKLYDVSGPADGDIDGATGRAAPVYCRGSDGVVDVCLPESGVADPDNGEQTPTVTGWGHIDLTGFVPYSQNYAPSYAAIAQLVEP